MSAKMSAEMKYAIRLVNEGAARSTAAILAGVTPSGIWRHLHNLKKKQVVKKSVDKKKGL